MLSDARSKDRFPTEAVLRGVQPPLRSPGAYVSVLVSTCTAGLLLAAPFTALSAYTTGNSPGSRPRAEYDQLSRRIAAHHARGAGLRKTAPAKILDEHSFIMDTDRDPVDVVLRRTEALLNHLISTNGNAEHRAMLRKLHALRDRSGNEALGKRAAASRLSLFADACALRRSAALSNPLLDFDGLLFCDQFNDYKLIQNNNHAATAKRGGGIYIVSGFKSGTPTVRNLVEGAVCENGTMKGRRLEGGAFNSPALHFDADRVVFAWCGNPGKGMEDVRSGSPKQWSADGVFNLFSIGIDGSELRQLTDTNYNDYHPCWLPNGRIVFISDRRRMTVRCGGLEPCGSMFSMAADGSDVFPISWHETSELNPRVDNDGMLVYVRWDYVDRDFAAAHHLWTCYPDGRDPRAPHGNYPRPHSTLSQTAGDRWRDERMLRPWMEYELRAIPGSHKYIAIAGGHHTFADGKLVLIDTRIPDDDASSQLTAVTPGCWKHEGCEWNEVGGFEESTWRRHTVGNAPATCNTGVPGPTDDYYSPCALSEDVYIVGQGTSLYLLDRFGNKELIVNHGTLGARYPVPVRKRRTPPDLAVKTWQGRRRNAADHRKATIAVTTIYDSDFEWPEGTTITHLRIVQINIKPWEYPNQNKPRIGWAGGTSTRQVLGVVPVEEDGSVFCEAPVECEIYFQALDSLGMAVQSMRSGTYVHPGEQLSCQGCHEDKWTSPPHREGTPIAFTRPPSKLERDAEGSLPFSFARLVKPVFENTCLPCHRKENKGIQDFGYGENLRKLAFYFHGNEWCHGIAWKHGGYRTIAGEFGAHYSELGKKLLESHIDRVSREDFHRVTLWLDLNSHQYGAYHSLDKQDRGEIVWPMYEVDPDNPQALDSGNEHPSSKDVPRRVSVTDPGIAVWGNRLVVQGRERVLHSLSLFTPDGRRVASFSGAGFGEYRLARRRRPAGVYYIRGVVGKRTLDARVMIQ